MLSWTIYSVGDVAFLEQIMIAVAMVTGTTDFMRAASIGLLFAFVIIALQSVMKGARELNYQQAFVGWILFACMFYPSTTVVLEDGVTGDVRVVSNVPLGVGAAGGMISTIGYGLTELFEQGYSYISPALTSTHFADSLVILNDLRGAAKNPRVMTALSEAAGGDVRHSWDNYIRECTLVKIDLGLDTVDNMLSAPLPEALRFDSNLFGTRHYLSGSAGTNATCAQAYDTLRTETRNALYDTNFMRTLGQALGTETAASPSAISSIHTIGNAMDTLRLATNDAYQLVQASILEPLYSAAVTGKYQDMQDYSSAVMINQAIQQRNIQWASEQSMFMSVIRPMQTFFEGFVYALTPLLGVLIITGSFGMTLAFKYLQTLLWIQFWLPVLSIINLYINVAAAGELSSLDNPGLTSIYSLAGLSDVLQSWVSVGGMLAAATPVISLFLVTGSTYAMTSIAGKISGADHVNEKIASPDAVQPSAVMASQAKFAHNTMTGTTLSGAEGLINNLSFGNHLSGNVSSAQEKSQQAQEQFSKQLSRSVESAASSGRTGALTERLGQVSSSIDSRQAEVIRSVGNQIGKEFGLSQDQIKQVTGAVALTATGGLNGAIGLNSGRLVQGTEKISSQADGSNSPNVSRIDKSGKGTSAGATGGVGVSFNNTSSQRDGVHLSSGEILKRLEDAGFSRKDSAAFQDQLAAGIESTGTDTWSHTVGDKAAKALTQSASAVVSTGNSYKEMAQLAQEFGSSSNARLDQVAGMLTNPDNATPDSKAALNDLNDYFRTGAAAPKVQANAAEKARFFESLGKDPQTAQTMGRLAAMMNMNNYDDSAHAVTGIRNAAGIINRAMGNDLALPSMNPTDNEKIAGPNVSPGALRNEVAGATTPATGLAIGSHDSAASAAYGDVAKRFDHGVNSPEAQENRNRVIDDHQLNLGNLNDANAYNQRKLLQDQLDKNENNLAAANLGNFGRDDMSQSTRFHGINDNFLRNLLAQGSATWGGIAHAVKTMSVSEGVQYLNDNIEAVREQAIKNAQHDYDLTPEQAKLLAYVQTGASSERIEQARSELINSYPESYSKTAQHIANHVEYAADAGEQAGAYLNHVKQNNSLHHTLSQPPAFR